MNKLLSLLRRCRFLIFFLIFFIAIDFAAASILPRYIRAGYFWMNDFEITQRDHPEEVWDKVFAGNSVVIAAYRQNESESGYVNLGMDYGVVKDFWEMIRGGDITVGSELVIGANWLTFYDEFETNPSYIWHRGVLEPYSYFQRDKIYQMMKAVGKEILLGQPFEPAYAGMDKAYYYGCLPDSELAEKAAFYEETYWNVGLDKFDDNLRALRQLADYCEEHGVRLRMVWMPWNPSVELPPLVEDVMDAVNTICAGKEIEVLDLTDSFDESCFYDIGHLNFEYGSHEFTKEIETWLNS